MSKAASIQDTGLDLGDVELISKTLAPGVGERVGEVLNDVQRGIEMLKSLSSMVAAAAATGPLAVATTIAGLGVAGVQFLQGRAADAAAENLKVQAEYRDAYCAQYYPFGAWSSVLGSTKAPPPKDLKVVKPIGWTRTRLVGQYDKWYLMPAARSIGQPVCRPIWGTPPLCQPDTPTYAGEWSKGWEPTNESTLAGFTPPVGELGKLLGLSGVFKSKMPPFGATGGHWEKYWCQSTSGDAAYHGELISTLNGQAIPPGYMYLRSWGTYPDWGWSLQGKGGQDYPDRCGAAAAIALALLAPTAMHMNVRHEDVAKCYRHWRRTLAKTPLAPKGQIAPATVVLTRDTQLPYATTAGTLVTTGDPGLDFMGPSWETARRIELAFRQFFRVRNAVLHQTANLSPDAAAAAAESPDDDVRAAVQGKPPPYKEWSAIAPDGGEPIYAADNTPAGIDTLQGGEQTPDIYNPKTSGGSGGGIVLVAGAAAAAYWLAKRKRR